MVGLETKESLFWTAIPFGILNYPTHFYDYVRYGTLNGHRLPLSRRCGFRR